ncbi:thioesterase family protein [Histidinibacterium lentulum]|nr:thioesterase family protein [Histidinibacterium lentulum]
MTRAFLFETRIVPEWIDYNGHMRDAYFNLVFSLAVDALQDEVGLGEAYRRETGCTIYLLEGHVTFLREMKEGAVARVETRVIGLDSKRFHLHAQMWAGERLAAVGEFMELNVRQTPEPRAAPMPDGPLARLEDALVPQAEVAALPHRARAMGLEARSAG